MIMNKSQLSCIPIPLTHIFILVTLAVGMTIWAATEQYLFALISCYLAGFCYSIYQNKSAFLIILLYMIIGSFLAVARINYQNKSYESDQAFLKSKVTLQGVAEQINRSCLIKDQSSIIVTTTTISNKKNTIKTPKKICLFLPTAQAQKIQEANHITFYDIQLEQPPKETDYHRYLLKEGLWAIAHGTKYTQYSILKRNTTPWQQKILSSLYKKINEDSSSLFDPLFLGKKEKNIYNLNIQHQSTYWGIAHHMARSGAHLAILFTLIMLLLHYTQFAYSYRYLLCIFLLISYALISQSSISFLRALCMILLHILSKICKRVPSSLHTISITTLVTLLYNPMQLFFLDFQLSFGITYIIIWLFNIKNSKTIAFFKRRLVHF